MLCWCPIPGTALASRRSAAAKYCGVAMYQAIIKQPFTVRSMRVWLGDAARKARALPLDPAGGRASRPPSVYGKIRLKKGCVRLAIRRAWRRGGRLFGNMNGVGGCGSLTGRCSWAAPHEQGLIRATCWFSFGLDMVDVVLAGGDRIWGGRWIAAALGCLAMTGRGMRGEGAQAVRSGERGGLLGL